MPKRRPSRPVGRRVRKNMDMDPAKLAAAQRVLGAGNDTETVDLALDLAVMQGEVFDALDRLAALGALDDPYGTPTAHSARRVAER